MNIRAWVHSLIAAFVGGASSAVPAAIVDPNVFNVTAPGLRHLGTVAALGGVVAVCALLKQSPLPASEVTVQTTVTKK